MKLQFLDNIKVFIFDIGKTLFDKQVHTKCSQSTIAALNLLRQKGYKVGVCTMRTFNHIRDIIDFTFDFYILNNGSFVMCENNILLDEPMNVEITKRDYLTYTPYETFFSSKNAKEKALYNGFIAEKEGQASTFYNLIIFDVETNELEKFKTNFDFYYWANTKTVSLQKKGCSRINAIKRLACYLGLKLNQVIYFGDGPNDLEVFKMLPFSIAMGDCFPELLKYATYQIDTCKNNGVANFIIENYHV